MGTRFERFNARLNDFIKPMRFLLLLSGTLCAAALTMLVIAAVWFGIPVLKAAAHAFEAQAKQVEANTISSDLADATKVWKKQITTGLDNFVQASADARDITGAAKSQVADTFHNANDAVKGITRLIDDARTGPLPALTATVNSVNGLVVDSKPQIVQALANVKDATGSFRDAAEVLDRGMKDPEVKAFVDDSMKHLKSIIGRVDTATGDLTLMTADGKKITTNLAGVTDDVHKMTTESEAKWNAILNPPKVKGFWPNVGRIVGFVYKPVFDGLTVYYRLQSLPIRITQSVPILAPKP